MPPAGRATVTYHMNRLGTLVVIDHGSRRVFGSGPPTATAHVRSPRVWPMLLLRGSRGLAESYAEGLSPPISSR
jgi:hypothetical protein